MIIRTIAMGALGIATLLGTASTAVAAEGMQAQPRTAIAASAGFATTKLIHPGKPMTTRLAESCDDNWWEFSLFQAIGCALRDYDDDDDSKKPEFLDQELWDRYYGG